MKRPFACIAVPAVFLAGACLAQAPPEQSGAILRSTTRLVQVDVIVQDKNGHPVTGLTKEDFIIKDGGTVQVAAAFSMESKVRVAEPARRLPPNVFSNRQEYRSGAPQTITAILIDGLNTKWGDQLTALPQIVRYLQQIQPEDRVAIYGLSRDLRVLHDFTSDTTRLLASLSNFKGLNSGVLSAATELMPRQGGAYLASQSSSPNEPSAPPDGEDAIQGIKHLMEDEANYHEELRIRTTLLSLEAISNHLASVPGRKNLLWVSSAFPLVIGFLGGKEMGDQSGSSTVSAAEGGGSRTGGRGGRGSRAQADTGIKRPFGRGPRTFDDEVNRAVRAMNNANLAVYPVDARGLPTDPRAYTNIGTMQELAIRTGGKAYYNTNDLYRSIREAVDDASVTYTLAYYPGNLRADGRFRNIKIKVNRPGVTVRHRKGYFDSPEQDMSNTEIREASLRAAAWSPLNATGLRVDARLDFVGEPERNTVLANVVVDPASVTLSHEGDRWTGRIEMFISETDDKGTEHEVLSQVITLQLTEETYRNSQGTGFTIQRTLPKKPQATTLRIAVRDAPTGNIGSLVIPFHKIVDELPAATPVKSGA